MRHNRIQITEIIRILNNNVIKIEGPVENVYIDNISDVKHTTETTLDWVNPNKLDKQIIVEKTFAKVVLVDTSVAYSDELKNQNKTLIYVKNPKYALSIVGNNFFVDKIQSEIHNTAIISDKAKIGENVYIGPYCVIGNVSIGNNATILSNVRIYDDVQIGDNCYIKEGSVIGGAGFGYEVDEDGNRFRFPQIGGVIIGNNVEIGSNTCIDRGALSNTIIRDYAKIDNLCHIAHNVEIGENAMIIACSEISGSCCIGENSWISPNVSIRDWKKVGNNSLVGIGSVVVKDVPDNEIWMGNPAVKYK